MGSKKWAIAAIIVLVLAAAAFLWFYDPEPPVNEKASGGPHILDEDLNPQVKART